MLHRFNLHFTRVHTVRVISLSYKSNRKYQPSTYDSITSKHSSTLIHVTLMRVEYSLPPALLSLSKSLLITVTIVSQCFLCFAVSIFYQCISLCPLCFSPHCVPCVFLCLLCFWVFHCAPCVSLCFSVFRMCPFCLCFTVSLVLQCILLLAQE